MRNIIIYLSIVSITFCCTKEDYKIENLNDNTISIFGHGGMGTDQTYPKNSFESIYNCLILDTDGTEIDVQMTRDSVLVAFHSEYLEYLTNEYGHINDKNWSEISKLTYIDPLHTSYKLISLDEMFSKIENLHDYIFTLDCKLYNSSKDYNNFINSFIKAIDRLSEKYNLHRNLHIESTSEEFLKILKENRNGYKLFIYPFSYEEGFEVAKRMDLYGITISTDNISKEEIERAHTEGLTIAIWDINSRNDNIEAINKNPDFIQTDRVNHLVKLLK